MPAMKTIPKSEAAAKMGLMPDELGDHLYLVVYGNAHTPERFWMYAAYTKKEFDKLVNDFSSVRKIV